jgi:hypothetical protein
VRCGWGHKRLRRPGYRWHDPQAQLRADLDIQHDERLFFREIAFDMDLL